MSTLDNQELSDSQLKQQIAGISYPRQVDVVDQVMSRIQDLPLTTDANPFLQRSRRQSIFRAVSGIAAAVLLVVGISMAVVIPSRAQTHNEVCDAVSDLYNSTHSYDYDNASAASTTEIYTNSLMNTIY